MSHLVLISILKRFKFSCQMTINKFLPVENWKNEILVKSSGWNFSVLWSTGFSTNVYNSKTRLFLSKGENKNLGEVPFTVYMAINNYYFLAGVKQHISSQWKVIFSDQLHYLASLIFFWIFPNTTRATQELRGSQNFFSTRYWFGN